MRRSRRALVLALGVAMFVTGASGALVYGFLASLPDARPDPVAIAAARALNARVHEAIGDPRGDWRVGTRMKALREMTVDVTADHLDDARAIAWRLVDDAIGEGLDEVLVYVRERGDRTGAVRRVQWTPRAGYSEMTFTAEPAGAN